MLHDSLIMSSVCSVFSFNQLCLPTYDSYEELHKMLKLAISEGSEGFGMLWLLHRRHCGSTRARGHQHCPLQCSTPLHSPAFNSRASRQRLPINTLSGWEGVAESWTGIRTSMNSNATVCVCVYNKISLFFCNGKKDFLDCCKRWDLVWFYFLKAKRLLGFICFWKANDAEQRPWILTVYSLLLQFANWGTLKCNSSLQVMWVTRASTALWP